MESILKSFWDNIDFSAGAESIYNALLSHLPGEMDLKAIIPYLLLFGIGTVILGILGRVCLGKRSSLNHSVSSAMAILFIYVVTIFIYTLKPWNLQSLLSPLPFVTFSGNSLFLFPIPGCPLPALSGELLSLFILAFLVNLIDTFIPQGESAGSWFLLRILTILSAMALHLVCHWAFHTFLPDFLVTYAPLILLGILTVMLLLGLLNVLLSLVLAAIHPILGAIYAFFFSNIIGKQMTKAVLTTLLLAALFLLLNYFGFYCLSLTQASLLGYLPAVGIILLFWFLIGRIL